jgi:hypothetical protein
MIRKFLHLSLARKIQLFRVSLLLLFVQAGLSLFSFAQVYHWVKWFHHQPRHPSNNPLAGEDICWAVTRAGKAWFGNEGCLAQALLGECLLIRKGVPAKFCLGVRRQTDGSLLAHAWIEINDQVRIGGSANPGLEEFQNFPDLKEAIN